MTKPRFATREAAKKAGWFSRRHETGEANALARIRYKEQRGREARQTRAEARLFEREQRSLPKPDFQAVAEPIPKDQGEWRR